MADDKGGSSWEWGILEIIIGILLIIGVMDHLFGRDGTVTSTKVPASDSVVQLDEEPTCGLDLTRPHANEKAGTLIQISGTVGDCDWKSDGRIALYAQIVDGKGKAVSDYTPVPVSGVADSEVSFQSTVMLTKTPAKGTGYLILVPAVPATSGGRSVSTRVPLKF